MKKESVMETLKEKIKRIRSQDNFPIWIIKEALDYYDGDEDKTIKKLIEIYYVIGDHPDVAIKRKVEEFMNEVQYSKAKDKLQEIREFLDNELHPVVSPNNWRIYSDLVDMIEELREFIEEDTR